MYKLVSNSSKISFVHKSSAQAVYRKTIAGIGRSVSPFVFVYLIKFLLIVVVYKNYYKKQLDIINNILF